jgi:exodeoxyribonuclease-3
MQTIKLLSWNVNGLRAAIRKGFLDVIAKEKPDILCLQETKAMREQVVLDLPDYEEYWNSAVQKGYSGTAIFTKRKPMAVYKDFLPSILKPATLLDDQGRDAANEGRILTLEFETHFVTTVYTPNTKNDLSRLDFRYKKWDPLFLKHVKALQKKKPVIFCGDLNVAHQEIDLARPKDNVGKHGFTDEEREGFENMLEAGFVDTFRELHPDKTDAYSWWTHWAKARERNVGWRIDYFLISEQLKKNVKDAFILPEVMGSDHCPVGIKISL